MGWPFLPLPASGIGDSTMKAPLIALLLLTATVVAFVPTASANHYCNLPFVGGAADSACETTFHLAYGSDGNPLSNFETCIALVWCE